MDWTDLDTMRHLLFPQGDLELLRAMLYICFAWGVAAWTGWIWGQVKAALWVIARTGMSVSAERIKEVYVNAQEDDGRPD